MTTKQPKVFSNPIHFLAFGFGSGLSPKAPGTTGTVVAVLIHLALAPYLTLHSYLTFLVVSFLAGIYLCGNTARDLGEHDYGGIVWDEFVGYWVAMFMVPTTWYWVAMAFILFRLFDIHKPFPIGLLDKKVHGGLGIMLDDLLAGIYALLLLQAAILFTGF